MIKKYLEFLNEINLNDDLFNIPKIDLTDDELMIVKSLNWKDIVFGDTEEINNDLYKCYINEPEFLNEGVRILLKLIELETNCVYKIDISLADNLQNLGLGYKLYKALINDFGHIYSGKGNVVNPEIINKIWDKLKNDNELIYLENSIGKMAISKNLEHDSPESIQYYNELIEFMKK